MLVKLIIGLCLLTKIRAFNLTTAGLFHNEARPHENVTLDCRVPNNGKVHWYRGNNLPFPKAAFRDGKKLIIPHITVSDSGMYVCMFDDNSASKIKKFFVTVRQKSKPLSILKILVTDVKKPDFTTENLIYLSGIEERVLPCDNSTIQGGCLGNISLFKCNNGEQVDKILRCNRKKDCSDGSDEFDCEIWPPKIIQLPKSNIELYCGSKNDDTFDMLELECEFVGLPEPSVKWKKYEGHVPSKCQQLSFSGRGILRCPKFNQADQGAYSCVAENLVGSSESQPKSVAKCKNFIQCNGFRVRNEEIEHCLECFCSGKTNKCQNIKSKPFSTTIPFPDVRVVIQIANDGTIVYIPSENDVVAPKNLEAQGIEYCELRSDGLNETSLLKSYGRNMGIPKYSGYVKLVPNAPDLIIQGNGITIFYNYHVISPNSNVVNVRFWPGNWHLLNKTTASREDIMTVLSNVERFLFRCEYSKDSKENWSHMGRINLETSVISEISQSVGYIEKCACPEGYAGLSCESCATGYKRKLLNLDFVCEKIQCNSSLGYFLSGNDCVKSPCSINGSISLFPDSNGKCKCKKGMSGDTCDVQSSCEKGYFREDTINQCLKCWCSGVTDQCNSSTLFRTEISSMSQGGYNSSNGRNFWLLPPTFSGNRLTSYGGHIKYALRYSPGIPKQTKLLSVEFLTVNENIFTYTYPNLDTSTTNNEKTLIIPLIETYWRKADKTLVNRSEFLTLLTKVKAIYIEAPYHLTSGKANLSWVRMSDAKSEGTELASEVEQCFCPPGYVGLSCESCSKGYYRNKTTNQCVKCDCENCDPVEGCLSCPKGYYLSNPSSKVKPDCKPCDCSGREEKCAMDNNNIVFCICQPGFTGLKCENVIPTVRNSTHLTVNISPSKLRNTVVGSTTSFNCSYDSGEKLKISFMKIYSNRIDGPHEGISNSSVLVNNSYRSNSSFFTVLDEDLLEVQCLILNVNGREVARVSAVILEHTEVEPVKITNCYSDILYVKEGKSTDLICLTIGSPKPVATWYIHKADNLREKLNSIDGVHTTETMSMKQNATSYTCEAENAIGDKDTCSILLIVQENFPVVHIVPKSIKVQEGENITLQCRTTAPTPVVWSGPKTWLPFTRTFQKDGNLNIVNSIIDDSGNYICKTVLPNGKSINQTAIVFVKEKLIPPTAIVLKDDVKLEIGSDFEVKCEGNGEPKPMVTWKKSSGTLASNVQLTSGILKIKAAILENNGIYECEAESKAGKDIVRILITVVDNRIPPKVDIYPSFLVAEEGERVRVDCDVLEGNPRPTLNWLKVRNQRIEEFQEGEYLEFKNISRFDFGMYQCQGKNSLGRHEATVEIDVMFLPNITTSKEEIKALENEEITVKCSAVGNPSPKLTWKNELKKNFKKRNLKENDVLASLYTNPSEITITLKVSNEISSLICEATNQVGTVKKEVPIRILPEFVPKKEVKSMVPIGSYHEFLCHGCTGKLIWERQDGPLIGDESEFPNGLMIPSVQIQHRGTYVCKCSDDKYFTNLFGIIVSGFVPKFTRDPKSYIVLPVMLKSNSKFEAEISFKTNKEDGLLLKDENNEFALYLQQNKIVTVLHSANKKRHHFTSTMTLKQDVWYTVTVHVVPTLCKITIYDENSQILEAKDEHLKMTDGKLFSTLLNNFFIGGSRHRPKNIYFHNSLPSHVPPFDGCISRLLINSEHFDLVKKGTYSSRVKLCSPCSAEPNLCKGMGKCFDAPTQLGFICVCPENQKSETCPRGCLGRNCDHQKDLCDMITPCFQKDLNPCSNKISSLSCRCSFGYSGPTCEKKDLSIFCVEGEGFVKLSSNHLYRSSLAQPENIELSIFLKKPNGVIFWRGNSVNYAAILVRNRKVEFIVRNQNVEIEVVGDEYLWLSKSYTLLAKRMNDSISLRINSNEYHQKTTFSTNRIKGDIYLGGAPDGVIPYNVYTSGLHGCIFNVSFGGSKINFNENVLETLNLTPPYLNRLSFTSESNSSIITESYEDEYESSGYGYR